MEMEDFLIISDRCGLSQVSGKKQCETLWTDCGCGFLNIPQSLALLPKVEAHIIQSRNSLKPGGTVRHPVKQLAIFRHRFCIWKNELQQWSLESMYYKNPSCS